MSTCDCLIGGHGYWCDLHPKNIRINDLTEEIRNKDARIEELESVLSWYANQENYFYHQYPRDQSNIKDDKGERARKVLEGK